MNIAITGVNGLLGSSLFKQAKFFGFSPIKLNRNEIVAEKNFHKLAEMLFEKNCSVLVHCAANTNVEACESDKISCYRDNVVLTEKLAQACRLHDIKFVFISSTGIYGNYQDEPYIEYDDVKPTTIHHNSKWQAEKILSAMLNNYLIIRTGWLFGGDWDMPKNFVANRIKEAKLSNGFIQSDSSQWGNPTYVDDVSKQIYQLVSKNYSGIFNCVNQGSASRFDYVSEIIKLSDLDVEVLPTDSASFQRKAKVSHNESAINFKLNEFGFEDMPFWKISLSNYLNSIKYEY